MKLFSHFGSTSFELLFLVVPVSLSRMRCSRCHREQPARNWTNAQWSQKRSNVGGRNECRPCWQAWPTGADWHEVGQRCEEVQRLSNLNRVLDYERFLIEFLRSMSSFDRKNWSYKGVLPIREPTDFSTAICRQTFDPGNNVYQVVIHREVPHIRELMEWSNPPNAETCGDPPLF